MSTSRRPPRASLPPELRPLLSRRSFLLAAGAGAATVTLAACGAGRGGSTATTTTGEAADTGAARVVWSNWPLYIDVDDAGTSATLAAFTQSTGIDVDYLEDYNDNAEFYAKVRPLLESGQSIDRDIVVPTDWMAGIWIRNGFASPLDKANIPNASNLIASLATPGFDADRSYTLPWQSGYGGLGWSKSALNEALGTDTMTSVDQLFDPRLKGRIVLLSEMRDTAGVIMAWQGADPTNFTDDDFYAALDYLQEQVNNGQIIAFQGNDYVTGLENGDITAVIGWSGDLAQMGEEFGFALPETRGNLWTDNLLIPVNAAHQANAEQLINYYYDPAVAAQVAAYVQYISPVAGAEQEAAAIDPALADNPLIFPRDEDLAKTFIFMPLTPEKETEYGEAWQALLGN
ncbi:MAG: spermidine/putrescine ABC transporter substrate-binding protein [Actinomycetales bacterium]|nr:spermidine/putrescine ABC transporter substrate-binding protein [Actinomycetales bacterium]